MKVTISKAAEMVGITRATFYRHIEKRGITIEKDEDGNPKVDVAELIRVYGDKVKKPELELVQDGGAGQGSTKTDTASLNTATRHNTQRAGQDLRVEVEVLKERVRAMEAEKAQLAEERSRERTMLGEQIDNLKSTLDQSQEQQKRLTALITHQVEEGVDISSGTAPSQNDLKELQETIAKLRRQNKSIFRRLQEKEHEERPIWKKLFS